MSVPVVARLHQWDSATGRLNTTEPIVCGQETTQGKAERCPFIARFTLDGRPMCVRHAQVYALACLAENAP